jgi:hypothetical protein
MNIVYALIATVAATAAPSATAPARVPLPHSVIVVHMCKETYGALMTLDDGEIFLFTDPSDPLYVAGMKLVKQENIGALGITPTFPCPVNT